MRFAIRDDDTSYFTRPEELERAYCWLPENVPVSLAVTPFAVESFHLGDPVKFYQTGLPQSIESNHDLVRYLRDGAARKRWHIMCHGFTHEYRRSNGRLIGECVWKPLERLRQEFRVGRDCLEAVAGQPVQAFVPPGNAVSRNTIDAMAGVFLGAMAAIPLRRWYEFAPSCRMWPALAHRAYSQLRWKGPSLYPQEVNGVRLLASAALTPVVKRETILNHFERCFRAGADLSVAVHYWELKDGVLDNLRRLVDAAAAAGCEFVSCPELLETPSSAPLMKEGEGEEMWAESKISQPRTQ